MMDNNVESGDGEASGFSFPAGNTGHSFDSMFSGVSLQSLLTLNPSLSADYPSLAFITDPNYHSPSLDEDECASNSEDHIHKHQSKLSFPKNEPLLIQDRCRTRAGFSLSSASQPLDLFSDCPSPFLHDSSTTFQHLPQLHSVEVNPLIPGPDSSFAQKRPRFNSLNSVGQDTYLQSPIPNSLFVATQMHKSNRKSRSKPSSSSLLDAPPAAPKSHQLIPQSNLARQRRRRISDKTRCLQKLMPWDKKMDQATLFEEAYKYVKFLQAQLYALQSMPSFSDSTMLVTHKSNNTENGFLFGDLERLNRTQVLQVLVNSPVSQTKLYAQGFCVFSMEQLTLLKNISERRLLLQQTMLDNPASKVCFN